MNGPGTFGWQDAAACRHQPVDLFFGPDGERQHHKPEGEAAARKVCARCPVTATCLEYALTGGITHGVFGGTGEDERRAIPRSHLRRAGEDGHTTLTGTTAGGTR